MQILDTILSSLCYYVVALSYRSTPRIPETSLAEGNYNII